MKQLLLSVFVLVLLAPLNVDASYRFTWGCPRDAACCNRADLAPCEFPDMINPCAVPCRPQQLQKRALPCAYKSGCPSAVLPCHGVSYTNNPYPIFK